MQGSGRSAFSAGNRAERLRCFLPRPTYHPTTDTVDPLPCQLRRSFLRREINIENVWVVLIPFLHIFLSLFLLYITSL